MMFRAKCHFVNGETKEFTYVAYIEGEFGVSFSIDNCDGHIFVSRSNVLFIELAPTDSGDPAAVDDPPPVRHNPG